MLLSLFLHKDFVLIKRGLLFTSLGFMIIPILWIIINNYSQAKAVRQFINSVGTVPLNLTFENITLRSLRNQQDHISLVSPNTRIKDIKFSEITFENPVVQIINPDHVQTNLIADHGRYIAKDNMIKLFNHINIERNKGEYKIKTKQLDLDLNNLHITLPDGINASFRNHTLKAKNVNFKQKSNKAIFSGGVKLVIDPNTENKSSY